jgi:hypothetical protein
VLIPRRGKFLFFASQAACAILQAGKLQVYDPTGKPLGPEIQISGRVRLIYRNLGSIVLATWEGEIIVVSEDGKSLRYSFAKQQGGFSIVGAVTGQAGDLYIGFWNGEIYHITPLTSPVRLAVHEAGIRALELVAGRLFLCDLEGRLIAFEEGKPVWSRPVEPSIHMLKAYPHSLVAVGERKLYHLDLEAMSLSEEPHAASILSALAGSDQFVTIDLQGKGSRYDPDLVIRSRFQVQPGTTLYDASQDVSVCALLSPEDRWSLLVGAQAVYRLSDSISISPRGDLVALGVNHETKLMKIPDLLALLGETRNE